MMPVIGSRYLPCGGFDFLVDWVSIACGEARLSLWRNDGCGMTKVHVLFGVMVLSMLCLHGRAEDAQPSPPAEEDAFSEFDDFEDEFGDDSDDEDGASVSDPLSGFNRVMFHVNDKLYFWIVRPVGRAVRWTVPTCVRASIERFFVNMGFPLRFVSNVLQLKFKGAAIETARFALNTTAGALGLLDPASKHFNLNTPPEDLGQVMGRYGIGGILPLYLPILGPTNLRDLVGYIGGRFLLPLSYVDGTEAQIAIPAGRAVNSASLRIGAYESLKKDALDPYTFMRDIYDQNRRKRIEE